MKVFCPMCGTENEAGSDPRVTCKACSATFDAPSAHSIPSAPQPARPQNVGSMPASAAFGSYGGGSSATPTSGEYNPFAIASVALFFCCPLISIILGIVALVQIKDSGQRGKELAWIGIALAVAMMGLGMCGSFISALGKH